MKVWWQRRLGPTQIADELCMPAPAVPVHGVLVWCQINRLSHIDRITGELISRYEF